MNHPHPNLSTPPKLVDGGLRIVALGGLTEIGRNMTVFEYKIKATNRGLWCLVS